jgi:hypothetical protein
MASRYGKAKNNMKNSFKILGAFTLLIALTFAFSAFKPQQPKVLQYWEYSGSNSPTDQLEYTPISSPSCASGTNNVCAILAEEDPSNMGYPKITGEPVEARIQNKDTNDGDVFLRN